MKLLVAVADVDALVAEGSAIDGHARANTTSVYTAAEIFPMLPERLSTDLTSLGEGGTGSRSWSRWRSAPTASVTASDVYRALVRNHAKLAYNGVAAWLDGTGPGAGGGRRAARARRAAPPPGARGAGDEGPAAPPRRAEPRDDRGAGRVRRRRARRPAAGREEPGQGADRGLHDRGQRRDRAVPRAPRLPLAAAGPALARALGPHRRAGRRPRRAAARGAERSRARGVPRAAGGRPIRRGSPTSRSRS